MPLFIYALNSTFKFGKYKGTSVKSVLETDISYINWCLINNETFVLAADAEDYAAELKENKGSMGIVMEAFINQGNKESLIDLGADFVLIQR